MRKSIESLLRKLVTESFTDDEIREAIETNGGYTFRLRESGPVVTLEVMTKDFMDYEDIADYLGITVPAAREYGRKRRQEQTGFPKMYANGRYKRSEVVAWAKSKKK